MKQQVYSKLTGHTIEFDNWLRRQHTVGSVHRDALPDGCCYYVPGSINVYHKFYASPYFEDEDLLQEEMYTG